MAKPDLIAKRALRALQAAQARDQRTTEARLKAAAVEALVTGGATKQEAARAVNAAWVEKFQTHGGA